MPLAKDLYRTMPQLTADVFKHLLKRFWNVK